MPEGKGHRWPRTWSSLKLGDHYVGVCQTILSTLAHLNISIREGSNNINSNPGISPKNHQALARVVGGRGGCSGPRQSPLETNSDSGLTDFLGGRAGRSLHMQVRQRQQVIKTVFLAQLGLSLAVCPWASRLTSLHLGFSVKWGSRWDLPHKVAERSKCHIKLLTDPNVSLRYIRFVTCIVILETMHLFGENEKG